MNTSLDRKTCSKCGEVKDQQNFYLNKSGRKKGKRDAQCNQCKAEYKREHYQENKEELKKKHKAYRDKPEVKAKSKIRRKKYYQENKQEIARKNKIIRGGDNKESYNQSQKKYRENNPEKVLCYRLRNAYGIDLQEYTRMYEEQGKKCTVCCDELVHGLDCMSKSDPNWIRRAIVDHCHTTGKVRDLICTRCNTALGLLREDIKIFKGAIKYIKKHERREIK